MTRLYLSVTVIYDAPDSLYGTDDPVEKARIDRQNFEDDSPSMWDTIESEGDPYIDVGVVPEDRCVHIIGHHVIPHVECILR